MLNSISAFSVLTREEKSLLFSQPLFFVWLSKAYVTNDFSESDLDTLALFRLSQNTLATNYFYEVGIQILDSENESLKLTFIKCCFIAKIIGEVTYNKLLEI